ncbi:MAG TPA: hypothetical protein VJU18_13180 [Vicinamibacteria bacterium]|nr:hypothetical protein [Vicinamibacteria bacterium]
MAFFRRLLHDPRLALFVLVFGSYAYFYQGGGWNQNSRFDLTRALVEQGTASIDAYEFNTGDKSRLNGRFYCDKAPGVSFLAVPVYAAFHPFAEGHRPKARLVTRAAYLATLLVVSLPSALAAVALASLGAAFGWPRRGAAALALAWALGTLAFPYATLLYGHQLAASLLLGAFAILARVRQAGLPTVPPPPGSLALAGLLLGSTVAVEYPPAMAVAVLLGYAALTVRPWSRLPWLVAGMVPPLAALAAYHWTVFGGPLTLPYHHVLEAPRHQGLFLGVSTPRLDILHRILIGEQRGLFVFAPWLLLALPGLLRLFRHRRFRLEGAVCLLVFGLFVAFNTTLSTSDTDWRAGWGMGPRHLIPSLPFLAIGAGGLLLPIGKATGFAGRGLRRTLGAIAALSLTFSVAMMLIATSVRPEAPTAYRRPFQDFLIPAFLRGELAQNTIPIHTGIIKERREAWNWGEAFGLSGLPALIPLGVWAAVNGAWLLACLRRQERETGRS